jgi:ATP-dependent RNA helicase RhlE
MPVSRDEQNGRNGRAMQHGRPGGGQRHGQGQGQRRDGQAQGDNRRQGQPGERQGEQRRSDALRGDRSAGDAPRNYARPKGKFHARPARPANAGGRGR